MAQAHEVTVYRLLFIKSTQMFKKKLYTKVKYRSKCWNLFNSILMFIEGGDKIAKKRNYILGEVPRSKDQIPHYSGKVFLTK